MHIPRYWARGIPRSPDPGRRAASIACWKWSDVSLEDAQRQADARAVELAQIMQTGGLPDRYAYGDRPLREEIVQTIANDAGDRAAIVTRNLYGALVLNTAGAMFIDIDFARGGEPALQRGMLGRLFGRGRPDDGEQRGLERLKAWADQQTGLGLRIYRTCAGLRCLVTTQTVDPTRPETIELLHNVGSDPLYVRLCQAQSCFRARLTPKPWRCGAPTPPTHYPWTTEIQESSFRTWQSNYERLIQKHGVCRLLRHIGPTDVHPEIQPILALHDRFTCSPPDRPLA